jgi:toxin ParE1/3/4
MEKYKLRLFPIATQDLQDIINYVNEQSSVEAFKLYDEIIENIGLLSQLPMRCPLMKSSVLRAKCYRVLVVHSYLVFYVVNAETVEIRRILHGKRQYDFLL